MAGEVLCPKCGTISPTETRSCPRCGTSLAMGGESTGRARSLSGARPVSAKPGAGRRPQVNDPSLGATAPDDTMMEEEKAPPRRPASKPGGPVPQAGGVRRATQGAAGGKAAPADVAASVPSAGRDSLIGRKLQEYVIEQKLGTGGMGVVYRATHQMIGKAVAIKVLRSDVSADPRDMERLLDEARIISGIKHRGIINIFGAGTLEDGRNYLIMELLEGESLEQRMQTDGKIGAGDAVVILEQVLSALTAAHEAGVVHRDLKPANVFLVKEGSLFYSKLLDFGLARRNQQNVTRIAGTPDYISPEHARGRPAGPPADLYAFGVLCFHMLTGRLPFIGNTPMEVMEQHVHSPPPVPHELNKEIPKALSELILKLLAKEPGERPDAVQVKADLRAATKQMRNAATMMSLVAIDPVVSDAPGDEKKRARELAVQAQVSDLKRKVTRRWPYVLVAVVAVWFVGVLVYVTWPAPPPPTPIGKRAPKGSPVNPSTDPPPKNPVAVADPTPKPPDPGPAPAPNLAVQPEPVATPDDAADAGEELVVEGAETVLDHVTIGERKRTKRVDINLGEMRSALKGDKRLQKMFGELLSDAEKRCEDVRTVKDLSDCEDEVNRLYGDYRNAL
jgi:serine/threonine protein kinase